MAFFAFAKGSLAKNLFVSCVMVRLGEDCLRCAVLGLAARLRGGHIIIIVTIAPRRLYIRIHAQVLDFEAMAVVGVAEGRFVVRGLLGQATIWIWVWVCILVMVLAVAIEGEIEVCILYWGQEGEWLRFEGMKMGTNRRGGVAAIFIREGIGVGWRRRQPGHERVRLGSGGGEVRIVHYIDRRQVARDGYAAGEDGEGGGA